MVYVIAEPCADVKDKACTQECPADCIYEGPRMLYIHPDECQGCGGCAVVCPVEAVFWIDDLPARWSHYETVNAEFFEDCGASGGATRTGQLPVDHPAVAALPPVPPEGAADNDHAHRMTPPPPGPHPTRRTGSGCCDRLDAYGPDWPIP